MPADRWERIQQIFDRALERPKNEQEAFVRAECADDREVCAEVLSLLGSHSADFLDPGHLESFLPVPEAFAHPKRIDDYEIVGVLGEGGMGIVYRAVQNEPVRRTVAIKLLKSGMGTREVVARFDTERQALALMSHANIAQVFGAGATADGRPYFAMEFVDGEPITTYCDRNRLGLRERLQLFCQVCEGIQHAHQKGIVHRDIKPSNVLVTLQNGRPVPKIIDFGIAKATDPSLVRTTMQTQLGQIVGTLSYMSPEQVRFTDDDIDTRTDIYSAGVLLYELLAGSLPFDTTQQRLAFDEICRHIREVDPPRPSSRTDRRPPGLESSKSELTRDLDWIVMKALEKERTRRYAGASEFAADIRRYLQHEPVTARPPDAAYRVRKFLRRHRVGVAFAALLLVVLIGGIVTTSTAMVRARHAEREAVAVADYLVDVFRLPRSGKARGEAVTALEILDEKSEEIRQDLAADPGPRGRFMVAMAEAYINLAAYEKAMSLLEDALPLLRDAYGNDHREVFNALNESGRLANVLRDPAQAKRYFVEALPIAERLMGRDHANVATILKNLGDSCQALGELEAARKYLQRALNVRTKSYGESDPRLAPALSSLAALNSELGDHQKAIELASRSLSTRLQAYDSDDPRLAYGHYSLAKVLMAAGNYSQARVEIDSALTIYREALGDAHPNVGDCLFERAKIALLDGKPESAYSDYLAAREIVEAAYRDETEEGRLSPALAAALTEYAAFLAELGRSDEAEAARRQAAALDQTP